MKFPIQVQKFEIPDNLKVSIFKIRIIYRTLICDIFKFDAHEILKMAVGKKGKYQVSKVLSEKVHQRERGGKHLG